MRGIVVRPMNDGESAGVVYHLSADLDAIAGTNGTARRDADVVDDLEVTGAAANVEGFVHRVRPPSVEEARRRGDRCREVDPGRRRAGVGSSQVHAVLITRHHLADKPEGWGSSLA